MKIALLFCDDVKSLPLQQVLKILNEFDINRELYHMSHFQYRPDKISFIYLLKANIWRFRYRISFRF